jgi:hypothetical protein
MGMLNRGKRRARIGDERLSRFRQRGTISAANEQAFAQLTLQSGDLSAQ